MAVLRAPFGAGRIRSLDTATAQSMPGVRLILTGEDVAKRGLNPFPIRFLPAGVKETFRRTPHYPLAVGSVHYAGEAVAAVFADTLSQAHDAVEAIELGLETRAPVVSPRAAAGDDAPRVWDDRDSNQIFKYEIGDGAGVDAAFANAAHVVREVLEITRVTAVTMEPRNGLAVPDVVTGRVTLHTGTQAPNTMRAELSEVLGLAPEALRIYAQDTGGSFGMRNASYAEDVLMIWGAQTLGRPVRWAATRSDSFLADTHSREQVVDVALALDADGRFLALRVDGHAAVGAQVGQVATHPMTANLPGVAGVYQTPLIHVIQRGMFVNARHMSPYRGAGRPEAIYIIERIIDIAAARLGMDRVELRRRNMIRPEQMPFATPLGFTYDSGDFPRAMERVLDMADWAGFEARRAEAAARGRLRGIGLCCAIEIAGGGPGGAPLPEFASIALGRGDDGGALATLHAGSGDAGQGHRTACRQMIGTLLGWDGAARVIAGDTDAVPRGVGSFGSRSMAGVGAALVNCARAIIDAARRDAAEVLEVAEADLVFDEGAFFVAGTDLALTLQALIEAHDKRYDAEAFLPADAPTFPNGAHAAEVEVDPDTGAVTLKRYSVVDDVGRVVNPLTLKGQIHGGVVQGLGQAFMEALVYDPDTANLLTGSLMDYAMPRAADMVSMQVEALGADTRANPLGVKGAGEAGTVGALAAGMNAVCDALRPVGVDHMDMPASPHRVWQAMQRGALANRPATP
jgi:carbon-monoxide dehydrogenase large subunit